MKRITYLFGFVFLLSYHPAQASSEKYVELSHLFSSYRTKPASVLVDKPKKSKQATVHRLKNPLLETAQLYLDALDRVLPLKDNPDYLLSVLVPDKRSLNRVALRERLELSLNVGKKYKSKIPKTALNKMHSAGLRLDYHFDTI